MPLVLAKVGFNESVALCDCAVPMLTSWMSCWQYSQYSAILQVWISPRSSPIRHAQRAIRVTSFSFFLIFSPITTIDNLELKKGTHEFYYRNKVVNAQEGDTGCQSKHYNAISLHRLGDRSKIHSSNWLEHSSLNKSDNELASKMDRQMVRSWIQLHALMINPLVSTIFIVCFGSVAFLPLLAVSDNIALHIHKIMHTGDDWFKTLLTSSVKTFTRVCYTLTEIIFIVVPTRLRTYFDASMISYEKQNPQLK